MAESKASVTKLDDGGYDVELEGGGRVILNKGEASNKEEAEQLARDRYEQSSQVSVEEPKTVESEEDEDGSESA